MVLRAHAATADATASRLAERQPLPWPAKLLLALAGLLAPLLLLELALRLLGPVLPGDYQTATFTGSSPLLGRLNRPNTAGFQRTAEFTTWVRVNSNGLRGPEVSYAKPPGVYRVLVLGDSFTFALQVDEQETFVARLAERLQAKRPGVTIETLNAGVDGWSTANEYAWVGLEGFRYQPDLVLVMFYVGNDPGDNADLVGSPDQLDRRDLGRQESPLQALRERLASVSLAYNLFEQGVLAKLQPDRSDETTAGSRPAKSERRGNAERKEIGWDISEALLRRMRGLCEQRGCDLAVVAIPTFDQVLDPNVPLKPLEELQSESGVPVIDLLPTFRAQPKATRERLYFEQNRHWTAAGHALAADQVTTELLRLGLPPGS
jgi:hypothetical protein